MLKADSRAHGKVVKIEWIKKRGITVDKIYAFQQNSNDLTGQFVGAFADLRLPELGVAPLLRSSALLRRER